MKTKQGKEERHEAYVLHSRPYRETSSLLDLWVRDLGRIKCVAKSSRQPKKHKNLDLFERISVQLYGRGELKTIYQWDHLDTPGFLSGAHLASAMYLNELLVNLMALDDPYDSLFDIYANTIRDLVRYPDQLQPSLRNFEFALFDALGYGLNLDYFTAYLDEVKVGSQRDLYGFYLDFEEGWQPVSRVDNYPIHYSNSYTAASRNFVSAPGSANSVLYEPQMLAAIAQKRWMKPGVLRVAKMLSRQVLAHMMGRKQLYSRQLLASMKSG